MKAFWITFRILGGIIQLLVVWWVLATITDHNTRLIVAVLGLFYLTVAGGLTYQTQMLLHADIANDHRFHELCR